jgi:hypothetical protein
VATLRRRRRNRCCSRCDPQQTSTARRCASKITLP